MSRKASNKSDSQLPVGPAGQVPEARHAAADRGSPPAQFPQPPQESRRDGVPPPVPPPAPRGARFPAATAAPCRLPHPVHRPGQRRGPDLPGGHHRRESLRPWRRGGARLPRAPALPDRGPVRRVPRAHGGAGGDAGRARVGAVRGPRRDDLHGEAGSGSHPDRNVLPLLRREARARARRAHRGGEAHVRPRPPPPHPLFRRPLPRYHYPMPPFSPAPGGCPCRAGAPTSSRPTRSSRWPRPKASAPPSTTRASAAPRCAPSWPR